MLSKLFMFRLLAPLASIVALSIFTLFYSEELTKEYIIFTYLVSIFSGGFSFSYRGKLLTANLAKDYGGKIEYIAYFIITFGSFVVMLALITSDELVATRSFSLLDVLLLAFSTIISAHIYSIYWAEGRLDLSYILDFLLPFSFIFFALFGLLFDLNYSVIFAFHIAFVCISLFLSRRPFRFPKVKLDIVFASLNSQLVVIISFFEFFFMAGVGSSEVVEYRWLMVLFSLFGMLLSVIRQRSLVSGDVLLGGKGYLAAMLLSLIMLVFVFFIETPFLFQVLLFGVAIVLQMIVSTDIIRLYKIGHGWLIFTSTLLTLIFGLVALEVMTVDGVESLFNIKLSMVIVGTIFVIFSGLSSKIIISKQQGGV
jgi:hypothetical protein